MTLETDIIKIGCCGNGSRLETEIDQDLKYCPLLDNRRVDSVDCPYLGVRYIDLEHDVRLCTNYDYDYAEISVGVYRGLYKNRKVYKGFLP